jgi:hypothetical protein
MAPKAHESGRRLEPFITWIDEVSNSVAPMSDPTTRRKERSPRLEDHLCHHLQKVRWNV